MTARAAVPPPFSAADLREMLSYDSATGVFVWKKCLCTKVMRVTGGKSTNGYFHIRVMNRLYMAHHLAWYHHYGEWPACEIDHADGDPLNNRIINLRLATRSLQSANTRMRKDNKSGFKGVHQASRSKKWIAKIKVNGVVRHLGSFDCKWTAHLAYARAARNAFGEFARIA